MGVNVDLSQAQGSTGNQSQLVLGEKEHFKSRRLVDVSAPIQVAEDGTVTGGDFPKFQPSVSAVDLQFLATLIESGVFTGSRARAAGYPGQLRGSGGFVAGSSPLVAPLLIRALMQDKNPSYHILGKTGKTFPSVVTVVDGQALAGKTSKTIADDLTGTTNVVQLKVTPKKGTESTVNVVDAQNLDTDTSVTIVNNLSEYGVPLALTVTPNSSADLDEATTPAEIIIKGLNANGNLQTLTLEFPDGSKTDAQSPTERFIEITDVRAIGWSAGTFSITVTLAADVTLGEGIEAGAIRIEGTGNNDEELGETLYYYPDDIDKEGNVTAKMTDNYYKEITDATPSGWAGGVFDITAQDKAVRIYIEAQDQEPAVFLHGEVSRGIIPAVIDDMLIRQLVMNLSPEEIVRFAIQTIYRLELEQQNLAGEKGESARKTDISALESPSEDFFIGFQGLLIIDGVKAPAKNVTLTVDQQWQHVGGLSGEQTDESLPIAVTRLVGLTGDFVYATQNNINSDFINNRKFKNLEVRLFNKLDGGFPAMIRVIMAKGQLNANPVPTYSSPEELTQPFEINILPTQVGASDDIRWILDVPEYHQGRIYN